MVPASSSSKIIGILFKRNEIDLGKTSSYSISDGFKKLLFVKKKSSHTVWKLVLEFCLKSIAKIW